VGAVKFVDTKFRSSLVVSCEDAIADQYRGSSYHDEQPSTNICHKRRAEYRARMQQALLVPILIPVITNGESMDLVTR
jgi:hypothetical protein